VKALERGMYSEQSWVGLSIPPKALLCVPGNHDKMRETGLVRYYVGFEQAPGPLNYVTFVRRNGAALVFFGIDSNEYTEGNVAMGEIDPARLAWLTRTLVNAEKKGLKVDDDFLTPDEFQQSTRCLILHHHPVDLKKGLKG